MPGDFGRQELRPTVVRRPAFDDATVRVEDPVLGNAFVLHDVSFLCAHRSRCGGRQDLGGQQESSDILEGARAEAGCWRNDEHVRLEQSLR